jgi:hypothetical protein
MFHTIRRDSRCWSDELTLAEEEEEEPSPLPCMYHVYVASENYGKGTTKKLATATQPQFPKIVISLS